MNDQNKEYQEIAEEVRQACLKAARDSFRDASLRGLCTDGAMEAAIGSIQSIDLKKLINQIDS